MIGTQEKKCIYTWIQGFGWPSTLYAGLMIEKSGPASANIIIIIIIIIINPTHFKARKLDSTDCSCLGRTHPCTESYLLLTLIRLPHPSLTPQTYFTPPREQSGFQICAKVPRSLDILSHLSK